MLFSIIALEPWSVGCRVEPQREIYGKVSVDAFRFHGGDNLDGVQDFCGIDVAVFHCDESVLTGKFVVEKTEVGSRVRGEWIGLRVEPLPCRTRTLLPAGRPEF